MALLLFVFNTVKAIATAFGPRPHGGVV